MNLVPGKPHEVKRHGKTYWRVKVHLPPDYNGKKETKEFIRVKGRQATEAALEFIKNYDPGKATDKRTFGDYLENVFLKHEYRRYQDGELSWTRYVARKSRLNRFVLNYSLTPDEKPEHTENFGKTLRRIQVSSLRPKDFTTLFNDELRGNITSPHVWNDLRQDFLLALDHCEEALPEPYQRYLKKVDQKPIVRKKRQSYDAQDIIAKVQDEDLDYYCRLMVAFIFIMLCRPEDMFALTWDDINWSEKTVAFTKVMRLTEDGWQVVDGSKTGEEGERWCAPLDEDGILEPLLRRLQKDRMKKVNASKFVFLDRKGNPFNNDSFEYQWLKVKKALDLADGPSFYKFKHLGISWALRNGVTPDVLKELTGHKDERMIMRVYREITSQELINARKGLFAKDKGKRLNPAV